MTPSIASAEQRELEAVVAELPGDVDVVGVARAARGDDGDVVEPVGASRLLAASDLYFHERHCVTAGAAVHGRSDLCGDLRRRSIAISDSQRVRPRAGRSRRRRCAGSTRRRRRPRSAGIRPAAGRCSGRPRSRPGRRRRSRPRSTASSGSTRSAVELRAALLGHHGEAAVVGGHDRLARARARPSRARRSSRSSSSLNSWPTSSSASSTLGETTLGSARTAWRSGSPSVSTIVVTPSLRSSRMRSAYRSGSTRRGSEPANTTDLRAAREVEELVAEQLDLLRRHRRARAR